MYTPKHFIDLGYAFDRWMLEAARTANEFLLDEHQLAGHALRTKELPQFKRHKMREEPINYHINIDAEGLDKEYLEKNKVDVVETIKALSHLPTVEKAAIMPDACPAGAICVGGVVATKNAIHPEFHSADVCCSMFMTEFETTDAQSVLDVAFESTHFGIGTRKEEIIMPEWLEVKILSNPYTKGLLSVANRDLGTQGDGNHFLFVGKRKSTGKVCVVTHHGSRGFGAKVFKVGKKIAQEFAKNIAPHNMPKSYAWIPTETKEGRDYWEALQIVRLWTHENHRVLHELIQRKLELSVVDTFWNEHNFVFKRDELYYHAKGATPGWLDTYDRTLVPMNMEESILITKGTNSNNGIGFLPHGAGRNMSRTEFLRRYPNPELPSDVKIMSYSGTIDKSELPQAYKNANEVKAQINKYNLAEVIDEILPYGTIMAGENTNPQPWRNKKT